MSVNFQLGENRITLREYRISDTIDVHAFASDPESVRFMTWEPNTLADTKNFINISIPQHSTKPRVNIHLVVTDVSSEQPLGGCGIHLRQPDLQIDDIGYCLHKSFGSRGFGTETAARLIRLGFVWLRLHRIVATCDSRNKASARVMEKMACV